MSGAPGETNRGHEGKSGAPGETERMVQNKHQDDLQHQTLLALERLEGSSSPRRGAGEALRPGDLVVLEETSEFDLEWLVLRRDADRQRYCVVPADTHPWTGCEDVDIAPGALGGPLSVRCGLSGWVNATRLQPAHRSGRLSDDDFQRVTQVCEQIEQKVVSGSMLQHETERSATYQEWLDTSPRPALRKLLRESGGSGDRGDDALERPASISPASSGGPYSWLMRWGSLAATLLLTAGIAFLGGLQWRSAEVLEGPREPVERPGPSLPSPPAAPAPQTATEPDLQREIERLQRERTLAITEQERQFVAQQREAAAQQREIDRLQQELQAMQTQPRPADPRFAILSPEGVVRGPGENVEIDSEIDYFLLLLLVESPDEYPAYRVVIRGEDDRRPLWQARLSKRSLSEILVQVPSGLLGEGTYRCELLGLKDAQETHLHEYSFRLAASG